MNLKAIRCRAGMTQAELANRIGKRPNTITQWELGTRQPKADLLPKLADVLGCTVDELLRAPSEQKETPA